MNTQTATRRITKATIKSFIKKNKNNLYLKVKRVFDGMIDGERDVKDDFSLVEVKDNQSNTFENTLGINGVWLVGSSRDGFRFYEDDFFKGFYCFNCCGSFILAIKK
jgi:hypothetical protein